MNPHELKSLQTQLERAKAEQKAAELELAAAVKKSNATKTRVHDLNRRIDQLQTSSAVPIVTEHAMLRWLQRVKGIDLDQIRQEILDDRTVESIQFARSGKYIRSDGITVVFQNNSIVTIDK